jgi:hypothetical protein
MGFKFVYDSINFVINFRKNVCYKNLQHKVYYQKTAHSALKSELQEKKIVRLAELNITAILQALTPQINRLLSNPYIYYLT